MAYGGANVVGMNASVTAGPAKAQASVGVSGVNVRGNLAPPVYRMVLLLVAIEVFLLAGGRIAFKHHHGG